MALTYQVARQFTRQTNTSSSAFTDVPGLSISNTFFEDTKKYLIIACGMLDGTNINVTVRARLTHAASAFTETEFHDEPDSTTGRFAWSAWAVWTAVAGEDIKVQFATELSNETVGITQGVLFALRLTDDFTEGTDWFFNKNTTSTTLTNADSTSNNAALSFTPGTAGADWLVLSGSQQQEVALNLSYQSKIVATGTIASSLPRRIEEGEDGGLSGRKVLSMARVYKALGAVAQTFTEVSSLSAAGTTEARLHSQLFAIDLSKFRNVAASYTEAGVDLSGTDYATNVQTASVTPAQLIDTLVLGFFSWDSNTLDIGCKARLQADSSDITAGPTTDALIIQQPHDPRDEIGVLLLNVANLSAAAHTINLDGSAETAAAGRAALYRSLVAIPLELAVAGSSPHPTPEFLSPSLGFGFGD